MTNARLARRRRKADDPAFLNRVAQACGIADEQARYALHWWLDQLEPLSEQERDDLLANIPELNRILRWRRQPSADRA